MAEQLNLQINIGGKEQIIQTFGELKKAIREAEFEAFKLSQQFGEADPRVLQLRKEIGALKDNLQDSAEATKNFAKGAGAFPAIAKGVQGIASGFAAVQGAIGLLGNESKELEKQILKVQSALALAQGIEGVIQAKDAFVNLGAIIKGGVTQAFKGLQYVFSSGLFLPISIIIATIAANWDKLKKVVQDSIPFFSKAADLFSKIVNSVTDFLGLTSEQERQLEGYTIAITKSNKAIENQIKLLQSQKGKDKEIYQLRQQAITNEISLLEKKQEVNGKLTDEEYDRLEELRTQRTVLYNEENQRIDAINQKSKEALAERRKREYDDFVNHIEKLKSQTDAEIELQKFLIDEKKRKEQELFDWRVTQAQKAYDQTQAEVELQKYLYDKDVAAKRMAEDMKYQIAKNYIDAVGFLFDRGTAIGKAAAIASIALDVANGFTRGLAIAQEGAKGTGPAAPFAFPLFYSTQVLAILQAAAKAKQTLATVKGGGALNFPTPTGQAPLSPYSANPQMTQLNQATINALGNQAVRAYVVETDITTNQKRIEAIKQKAKFG